MPKPIPQQLFVAEVEIEPDDPDKAYEIGLKARVLKVISGALVDDVVLRLPETLTVTPYCTCHRNPNAYSSSAFAQR